VRASTVRLLPLAVGLLLTSCAPPVSQFQPSPERDGTYQFVARDGGFVIVEGRYTIKGDAVTIDATSGVCVERPRYTGTVIITSRVYDCGESELRVDIVDPTGGSSVAFEKKFTTIVSECVNWRTLADGRRECTQRQNRSDESFRVVRAKVRAVRVAAPAPAVARNGRE